MISDKVLRVVMLLAIYSGTNTNIITFADILFDEDTFSDRKQNSSS